MIVFYDDRIFGDKNEYQWIRTNPTNPSTLFLFLFFILCFHAHQGLPPPFPFFIDHFLQDAFIQIL